jgi:hypothetical protein
LKERKCGNRDPSTVWITCQIGRKDWFRWGPWVKNFPLNIEKKASWNLAMFKNDGNAPDSYNSHMMHLYGVLYLNFNFIPSLIN